MKFLKVLLRSSAGEVELDTRTSGAPFGLLDGVRGFGLPARSVESSPLPSANGSVFRSGRFDESEVLLPIAIRGVDASVVADRVRQLEHVLQVFSDEPIELVVEAPALSTVRRRYVYYTEGLEGAIGGQDSHFTWRHANVKFQALDPMWYGQERVLTQRVDAARKPFITSKLEEPAVGAVVHREDRAPTASDAGTNGDVWFVGKPGRDEEILATNLVLNPPAAPAGAAWGNTGGSGETVAMSHHTRGGLNTARATLTSTSGYTYLMPGQSVSAIDKLTPVTPGETISASMLVACSVDGNRNLRFGFRNSSGVFQSWSSDGPSTALQADGDLVELKIENVTVPSGAAYAYVHTRGPLEGQGNWIEGTHAQVVKSPTVGDYFSGDTEPGTGPDDPHYRWTGPAHASTSEKYLPATEFKPTDRYVHNGTEWEQVGLEKRAPFLPIVLASSTVDGAYQLNIQGDAEAWPIWEIDGPGEDLLIENVRTGERIFIEGEFGETVTIDTRPTVADIYSDSSQDGELWERVADDYTLFPLTPGENRIKITMVNARPNSVVRLRYSETWLAGW